MDSLESKLSRVTQVRQSERVAQQQRYQESSRDRLLKLVQKKMRTSFIGALAKMEEFIGEKLWGHGKSRQECTEDELYWRDIWDECRTEILNNGNNQLRAVESEIAQYTMCWNRFQTVLRPSSNQGVKDGK